MKIFRRAVDLSLRCRRRRMPIFLAQAVYTWSMWPSFSHASAILFSSVLVHLCVVHSTVNVNEWSNSLVDLGGLRDELWSTDKATIPASRRVVAPRRFCLWVSLDRFFFADTNFYRLKTSFSPITHGSGRGTWREGKACASIGNRAVVLRMHVGVVVDVAEGEGDWVVAELLPQLNEC